MNDQALVNYCAERCKIGKEVFSGARVNRMVELAGNPDGYETLLPGKVYSMHGRMQLLVDYARMRLAVPRGGLRIEPGHAYRGCNGEVRHVVSLHPHHKHGGVTWDSRSAVSTDYFSPKQEAARKASGRPCGYMRLPEFKQWAIAEVAL